MINRRLFLGVAVSVLIGSPVFAGGGRNATIGLLNATAGPVAMFIDPDPAALNGLPLAPTQAEIEAAGGWLVNTGAMAKKKVRAGTYELVVFGLPKTTLFQPATVSVVIGRHETKRFAFNGTAIIALQ